MGRIETGKVTKEGIGGTTDDGTVVFASGGIVPFNSGIDLFLGFGGGYGAEVADGTDKAVLVVDAGFVED